MSLLRLACFLMLLHIIPAIAAPAPPWLHDGGDAFDELARRQAADFESVEGRYATERTRRPDDIRLAIAQCDFYWNVWDLEGVDWSSVASGRHAECLEKLKSTWPESPEVLVFVAEQTWGDDGDVAALELWKGALDWPEPMRGRLAHRLARGGDGIGPGLYAVEAVKLGHGDSLPKAIQHLASTDGIAAAASLAASAPLARDSDELDARLRALLELEDSETARDHLRRHRPLKIEASAVLAARSLIRAGDFEGAQRQLHRLKDDADRQRPVRLELALAQGDATAAAEHFEFEIDDFPASAETYARIVSASPLTALTLPMLPATVVVAMILMVLMLLPIPLLLPVHYRGLARRLSGKATPPIHPDLGLVHAWYAMGVAALLVPMLALLIGNPAGFGSLLEGDATTGSEVFSTMLWSTLGSLVAMLPLLYWMRKQHWIGPLQDLRGLLPRVLGAYALTFTISFLVISADALLKQNGVDAGTSSFHQSLQQQGIAEYGVAVTFLVLAVLVPLFEEWLFRGVLLGAMTRHISFGWANLFQATLFMLIHDDTSRFAFYLAFGLLAGWLVKRYRYLLPAILLHILNNGVATWLAMD